MAISSSCMCKVTDKSKTAFVYFTSSWIKMILKLCSGNLALKMTVLRQINIPKIRQTYAAANLEKPETYFPGVSILCFHVPVALQCMRSLLGAEQGSCGPCIFFVGKFSDIEALPCRRMMDFLFCLILMCAVLSVPTLQFFFFFA